MTSLGTSCMHGLDERGIAREGVQGGRLIGPEEHRPRVLLPRKIRALEPGERLFAVTPDPLERVQLRTRGRPAHEAHGFRQGAPRGGMGPAVVQPQESQAIRQGLGEQIDEELELGRIPRGPFSEAPVAGRRLSGAIAGAPREDGLPAPNRLHAARGQAPAANRQSAEATFVWAEHPDGPSVGGWNRPLEVCLTGGLEGQDRFRVFLCGWGGPL
jgi:hypothetical protein